MKKSIAWILTVIMMLALLTGCGSKSAKSDTEYVKKNGKLIVGITDYEPMDYKDENGEWTGFDAEFARMFAKELGVDCEFFVIADWGQKFFELDSKNIDAIWNGMTITDEVTLNTSCSNPYVVNAQVVIMKADVVGNYTSTDSLKDLTFAVRAAPPVRTPSRVWASLITWRCRIRPRPSWRFPPVLPTPASWTSRWPTP